MVNCKSNKKENSIPIELDVPFPTQFYFWLNLQYATQSTEEKSEWYLVQMY